VVDDRATLEGRAGTNTVLITHFPNVKGALGMQIGFGEAAILKPDGPTAASPWSRGSPQRSGRRTK
jgi:hypothetical protein